MFKTNNNIHNLEWVTQSENNIHYYETKSHQPSMETQMGYQGKLGEVIDDFIEKILREASKSVNNKDMMNLQRLYGSGLEESD